MGDAPSKMSFGGGVESCDAKMGVVGTADGENGIGSSMASSKMCVQNEFGEQQGKLTSVASGQDTS